MAETMITTGTVCWIELGTSDAAGAKRFYADLFGWTYDDSDMGGGFVYSMYPKGPVNTGGMYELMPEMKAHGVPPHWMVYFAVPDVDARAAKATSLGGKILREPMDVADHGRMVVVQDPLGATFALWQAKNPNSVAMPTGHGSFGWAQLNAHDPGKAPAFYSALLGWTPRQDPMPGGGGTYTTWMAGDQMAGGMMAMPPGAGAPSHWLVYFNVNDVDATVAKATRADATTRPAGRRICDGPFQFRRLRASEDTTAKQEGRVRPGLRDAGASDRWVLPILHHQRRRRPERGQHPHRACRDQTAR